MTLILERFNYAPDGTFGRITLPSGKQLFTCEQPWNGNATGKSCIPEGIYSMAMRDSPVVERSSGGKFTRGWEVLDVPGRTFIMFHPANWPHELKGCIAPGVNYAVMRNKQGVTSSRDAFTDLMDELNDNETWLLQVRQYRPEFP